MQNRAAWVLIFVLGCGGGEGARQEDAGRTVDATAVDSGHDGGVCVNEAPCPVTWTACQARSCDETLGCGLVTAIREGFDCDDGNASTYGDSCSSGTCIGTPLACTVNNGGCGSATCVGHDPAAPTCQCSGRYNVTASEATDATTGLTWERTASAGTYTQTTAATRCAGLGSGWRVPARYELQAIVTGIVGPRIDACAFPATVSAVFWSSTPVVGQAGVFWASDFGSGSTPGGETGDVGTVAHLVRCVR